MTDKKKKRARSISQKTGMTHQAAVNQLNNAHGNCPTDCYDKLPESYRKLCERAFDFGLRQLESQLDPETKNLSKFRFDLSFELPDGSKVSSRPEGSFTETSSTESVPSALSCFTQDILDPCHNPIYDVGEKGVLTFDQGQIFVYAPKTCRVSVPLSAEPVTEEMAWRLLLTAAHFTKALPYKILTDDLSTYRIVSRDGIRLAVGKPEEIGCHVVRGSEQGIFLRRYAVVGFVDQDASLPTEATKTHPSALSGGSKVSSRPERSFTETSSTESVPSPLSCFTQDVLDPCHSPIYDVGEKGAWFLNAGQVQFYAPKTCRLSVPLSTERVTEEMAWKLLVTAAQSSKPIPEEELNRGLSAYQIVARNGRKIAVCTSEGVGCHIVRGAEQGLFLCKGVPVVFVEKDSAPVGTTKTHPSALSGMSGPEKIDKAKELFLGAFKTNGEVVPEVADELAQFLKDLTPKRDTPEGKALESVLVTKTYSEEGVDGPGWYLWETECPEEGYFYFGTSEPTLEDLQAICPTYVFKESCLKEIPVPVLKRTCKFEPTK
jgi:hypothetical protein